MPPDDPAAGRTRGLLLEREHELDAFARVAAAGGARADRVVRGPPGAGKTS